MSAFGIGHTEKVSEAVLPSGWLFLAVPTDLTSSYRHE